MKGLYFINTDVLNRRAHTTQILNTVSELGKHLDIEIVAPYYGGNLEGLKVYDFEKIPNIKRLGNLNLSPGLASFLYFNIPASIYMVKNKPDFIYIRSTHFFLLATVAKMLGVPYFYETHRVPLSISEKFRDRILAKNARGIVVISSHVGEYYKKYNKNLLAVHDAVSLKRFVPVQEVTDEKVVVYTGTISKLKGVDYLVEAARLMPEVKFVLAGILHKDFLNFVWPDNVEYVGKVEQSELPQILSRASVLVIPHPDNEYSQSPMKLFEYMASGVPIVSTNLVSLREVLNEKNAVLVKPNDPEALKEGIEKAFGRTDLGEQAKVDVLEYTWEKRGEKISNFIKQCRD
jgi:glycosyltransferase involved in cell wall biosynthesis